MIEVLHVDLALSRLREQRKGLNDAIRALIVANGNQAQTLEAKLTEFMDNREAYLK